MSALEQATSDLGQPVKIGTAPRAYRRLALTPLVDVVFLLLVFFMLASRLDVPQAIVVEAPVSADDGEAEDLVRLRMAADGRLTLNGVPLANERLPTKLAPFLARDPVRPILVRAAKDAPLRLLVRVLDALRAAGADNLVLVGQ